MYAATGGYCRKGAPKQARLVVMMSPQEVEKIDGWAIPAGMTSRSSAIRVLLEAGLQAMKRNSAASAGE